jgi:NUMOD3 motif
MLNQEFPPTVLLVMQHNITGLKYFCKTSLLDRIQRYKGSGTRWLNHLGVHGKDITVGIMGLYTDKQRCLEVAKKFSADNDIVNSDEWANLVEETGMKGASMKGERNPFYGKKHTPEVLEKMRLKKIGVSVNKGAYRSPENRAKISASLKGRKNPAISKALTGRKLPKETIEKIKESRKGYTHSMETREKLRLKAKAQWAKQKADEVTQ